MFQNQYFICNAYIGSVFIDILDSDAGFRENRFVNCWFDRFGTITAIERNSFRIIIYYFFLNHFAKVSSEIFCFDKNKTILKNKYNSIFFVI